MNAGIAMRAATMSTLLSGNPTKITAKEAAAISAPDVNRQSSVKRALINRGSMAPRVVFCGMRSHTKIQMTMRYVHPAEEQKRVAVGKLEMYRLAQIVAAVEKNQGVTTKGTTLQ